LRFCLFYISGQIQSCDNLTFKVFHFLFQANSGTKIPDEVVQKFDDLKTRKLKNYIVFKIDQAAGAIILDYEDTTGTIGISIIHIILTLVLNLVNSV